MKGDNFKTPMVCFVFPYKNKELHEKGYLVTILFNLFEQLSNLWIMRLIRAIKKLMDYDIGGKKCNSLFM